MRGRTATQWWGTAIEAPDPRALATFYSSLLDWSIVHEADDVAIIKPPQDGVYMVFQLANDFVAPVWPAETGDQRTMMHLDIEVTELDEAVAAAISLGAREAQFQPQENVRVLFDPVGHPFCLCRDDGD
ncbi:MAG: VOC family protein [Acidimicrobiales bacterium]